MMRKESAVFISALMVTSTFLSSCSGIFGSLGLEEKNIHVHKPERGGAHDSSISMKPLSIGTDELHRFDIRSQPVEVRKLPVFLNVAATVEPISSKTTPVSSVVDGRIEDVLVEPGAFVNHGQVLAVLRSDELGTLQADFLQRILEYRADARRLKLSAEYLLKQFERKKYLFENKIGSKADLESVESDLKQAEAEYEAVKEKEAGLSITTKERLKLYGVTEQEVESVLRDGTVNAVFEVRSPRFGHVTQRDVDPGEIVDRSKRLFEVTDLSSVWFVGQTFEKNIADLKLAMPVSCSVQAFAGKTFEGKLDYLGFTLDPETRTMPVRATVANRDFRLRPNMFGKITIQKSLLECLAVPSDAIQNIGEKSVVYVQISEGEFMERKVELGQTIDDFVEIVSGLRNGERVVVSGSIHLLGMSLRRLAK